MYILCTYTDIESVTFNILRDAVWKWHKWYQRCLWSVNRKAFVVLVVVAAAFRLNPCIDDLWMHGFMDKARVLGYLRTYVLYIMMWGCPLGRRGVLITRKIERDLLRGLLVQTSSSSLDKVCAFYASVGKMCGGDPIKKKINKVSYFQGCRAHHSHLGWLGCWQGRVSANKKSQPTVFYMCYVGFTLDGGSGGCCWQE